MPLSLFTFRVLLVREARTPLPSYVLKFACLCLITSACPHLLQVACQAVHHIKVCKNGGEGEGPQQRVTTHFQILTGHQERVEEVAAMMGG